MNPGEIYWVEFPVSAGHEQSGRRPAILLQEDTYAGELPLSIVVPLTGATVAARFAGTLTIEPDANNGLHKSSVALVFQIRAVDRRAIAGRIGAITVEQREAIYDLLDKLIGRTQTKNSPEPLRNQPDDTGDNHP